MKKQRKQWLELLVKLNKLLFYLIMLVGSLIVALKSPDEPIDAAKSIKCLENCPLLADSKNIDDGSHLE